MKNRGQAAMEFLMTYGWAILAAIIVIAVLAIYFRPSNLVGQVSVFNPPLTAVSQTISASSEIAKIELKNNGAEGLTINAGTNITATINSPSGSGCIPVLTNSSADAGTAVIYPYTWNPATSVFLRCTSSVDLVEGRSFDANIQVTYTSGSGTLPKISTGSISGKINA